MSHKCALMMVSFLLRKSYDFAVIAVAVQDGFCTVFVQQKARRRKASPHTAHTDNIQLALRRCDSIMSVFV